ncbi:MAG: hypothetical protein VX000_06005, partial [Myxococcota bacterium]|nr:hypothetical protein [Myxococcota bacterium]
RGNDAGFAQDTGNVALTVLGPELQVLETNILTSFSPPSGAMRPALLVDGDEIVVSFDVGGALHTVQARVDVEALRALQVVVGSADGAVRERRGVEDTGLDSSSGPAAVADHGDGYAAAERGGCASVPAPAGPVRALAFVGLLGLLRRRG